jgi:hypothetical protein
MSVQSFIPEVWSASILRNLEKASVFAAVCNRDYQGEIAKCGDVVKVPKIGPVAVRDYQKGGPITYDAVDGSTIDIPITEQKYFAIKADDVDKIQSAPAFLDGATKNAAYALRDTIDSYTAEVLTMCAGTKLYEVAPWSSIDYVHLFALLAQNLDEQNVPRGGRWVVIPPFVVAGLTEAVIKAGTSNERPISEGFVTRIAGLDVYMSNNLKTNTDGTRIIAGVSAAATHIMQLNEIETLRDQSSFADLVRGLALYTSAVLLPAGIVTALVEKPED